MHITHKLLISHPMEHTVDKSPRAPTAQRIDLLMGDRAAQASHNGTNGTLMACSNYLLAWGGLADQGAYFQPLLRLVVVSICLNRYLSTSFIVAFRPLLKFQSSGTTYRPLGLYSFISISAVFTALHTSSQYSIHRYFSFASSSSRISCKEQRWPLFRNKY